MPPPSAASRSGDVVITNAEIARIFREIGDMLEILGEVVYKSVAYRRVADAVERHPRDVAALFAAGTPPKIPGAGPALTTKLAELASTGTLEYYERLRAQVPDGLLEMLQVPGVGPRTVRLLYDQLGIDSLEALRAAAADGQLRSVKGLSARTEENILAGIARLKRNTGRLLLHEADRLIGGLLERLREVRGVVRIEPAGSLRRRCATIGDLDLLAATTDPATLIAALDGLPDVERVLSAGTDKSSIVLAAGPQVDLMVCPPGAWGTHLVHFTGSKEHNVRLRGMALDIGLSLSEKGFKVIDSGELITEDSEEAVYARLGLPWIPPELREDTGEVQAALRGELPQVLTTEDVCGDTHVHSDWTDGVDSMEAMARAARDAGRQWMVLTDHSPSLGITRGLAPERVEEQRAEIARLNAELAPFRILHGTEMEIRADGSLDYPDELLARFDVVVASVHTARGQSSEQLTRRTLAAIANPHVDVIAHPTGRIVNRRDPIALDWPRVFAAAAETGTALEINGSPRLDLDDALARAAARAGVRLTLASDAHRTEELNQLAYAVSVARRAWLTREQVLGTRGADELLELLR
ncbi:MAG TPA: DNA polymerase/3'-5' exonuclease PolX [candidate division Zixibacteria bacterium]|nr:DNA polymerase/3'-5' exonuclease PolX [candidate division Zixibacteria bacterium]